MVTLENGEVSIGSDVVVHDKEKNTRRLGKFESLYEGLMNVRLCSDNSLVSVPFKTVTCASPEIVEQYFKNRSREELLCEVARLQEALSPHNITLSINKEEKS